MRIASIASALFFLFVAFAGCAGLPNSKESIDCREIVRLTDSTFQFSFGYIIYYRCEEVFVIQYRDLGYNDAQWFYRSKAPAKLVSAMENLMSIRGETRFIEGQFGRTLYLPNSPMSRSALFDREQPEFQRTFELLRRVVVRKEFETKVIPDWLKNDMRIDKRYGLEKGAWDHGRN